MNKIVKIIFIIFIGLVLCLFLYLFWGGAPEQKKITWGVNFSQMQAENLKLNWKETYLAMMDDLGAKNIKLLTQWDWVEGKRDEFYFKDIDWQMQQAEARHVSITYVVGMKTGRWPECHAPSWAHNLSKEEQRGELLKYVQEVVTRYKSSKALVYWQVENEPLLKFGSCPSWYYDSDQLLVQEVRLVKSLDPDHPVIVSDSGELSWWLDAAKIGDELATTMYRRAWVNVSSFGIPIANPGFYSTYPLPPKFYYAKAEMVNYFFHKKVICGELQAEPWGPVLFYDLPLSEQEKTMNLSQFKANISYAKKTGLDTFYLWGAEWWYWMKTTQHMPEIWNEARKLFVNQ